MPEYTCMKCDKSFNKKSNYDKHVNRKTDCTGKTFEEAVEEKVKEAVKEDEEDVKQEIKEFDIKVEETQKIDVKEDKKSVVKKNKKNKNVKENNADIEAIKNSTDSTAIISKLVINLHDMFRNREAIIGTNAYQDISKIMFIAFIQPYLDTKLKTLTDLDKYPEHIKHLNRTPREILDADILIKSTDENRLQNVTNLWDLLNKHPVTKPIFIDNSRFRCNENTFCMALEYLIKETKKIKFEELDEDVKGKMYEYFMNHYSRDGKELGQFFTPRPFIKVILDLNKELFPDFKPESIYDPCMGTAGFLTEMYKTAKKDYQTVITPEKIGGVEINAETYNDAIMNLILTIGLIPKVNCSNSILNNKRVHYDWICTNPPFGTEYTKKELEMGFPKDKGYKKEEMYPIFNKNVCVLMIQHCIAKLQIDGICNIVIPNGEIIYNKTFMKVRQYLMTTCTLFAVIRSDKDTFGHTKTLTVCLIFQHKTPEKNHKVTFYDNTTGQGLVKLDSIPNSTIANNQYILKYEYYKNINPLISTQNLRIVKLGDLVKITKGKLPSKKTVTYEAMSGYKFITKSFGNENRYHNKYDYDGEAIYIKHQYHLTDKVMVYYYDGRTICSNLVQRIEITNPELVDCKYLYWYLTKITNTIVNDCKTGSNQTTIDLNIFKKINIPLPPLEDQILIGNEITEISEMLKCCNYNLSKTYLRTRIEFDKYCTPYKDEMKTSTTKEILKFIPTKMKFLSGEGKSEGKYKLYTCAKEPKYVDEYEFKQMSIILNTGGSADVRIDKKFSITGHNSVVTVNKDYYNIKYIYYCLYVRIPVIQKCFHGSGLENLHRNLFDKIELPIPSLEAQNRIVEFMDEFEEHIEQQKIEKQNYEEAYQNSLRNL